jgi:hypothetical protein
VFEGLVVEEIPADDGVFQFEVVEDVEERQDEGEGKQGEEGEGVEGQEQHQEDGGWGSGKNF